MYYVLFHYTKGKMGLGVQRCNAEADVIEFLHEQYKEIDLHRIIEVKAEYCLGLIETEEYIRSSLVLEEESESLVELGRKPEEILKENKEKLEEIETEEPSDMEKIINETEEDLTPEEKEKKVLDDADQLIAREKKREEQKKKGWPLCTVCNSNRTAPWNEKGICSECQNKRKTTRPYGNKEYSGP